MTALLLYDNIPNPPAQRGVDRYFREIAAGVATSFGSSAAIMSMRRHDIPLRRYPIVRLPRRFLGARIHDRQASGITRLVRPKVVFNAYFGHLRATAQNVFPLYDMIYERFPEHFPRHVDANREFIKEKQDCLRRASLILAISRATAEDCLRFYPDIDPSRIRVTHLGVDESFFDATPTTVDEPYLLYVGSRTVYKNFSRLVEAFARSGLANDFELLVISPTGGGLTADEQALVDRRKLGKRIRVRTAIADDELRSLYAGATAFAYPSEYEGFGLPVIEALAAGTLVATSDRSSMPEIGGDVPFYFDPADPDDIASRLVEIAELSQDERERRCAAGVARAKEFSWQRCRDQTNAAIRSLM